MVSRRTTIFFRPARITDADFKQLERDLYSYSLLDADAPLKTRVWVNTPKEVARSVCTLGLLENEELQHPSSPSFDSVSEVFDRFQPQEINNLTLYVADCCRSIKVVASRKHEESRAVVIGEWDGGEDWERLALHKISTFFKKRKPPFWRLAVIMWSANLIISVGNLALELTGIDRNLHMKTTLIMIGLSFVTFIVVVLFHYGKIPYVQVVHGALTRTDYRGPTDPWSRDQQLKAAEITTRIAQVLFDWYKLFFRRIHLLYAEHTKTQAT